MVNYEVNILYMDTMGNMDLAKKYEKRRATTKRALTSRSTATENYENAYRFS